MKLTHAMVLAAGLGTRMRPLTDTLPKPLIPVRGQKLIDWCLDWLEGAGIQHVVVNSSYRAVQLEAHLLARGGEIRFSREEPSPLETGGGIAKALPMLGDAPFLVMNSDAIFPPIQPHPVTMMAQAWSDDIDFLMLVVPKERAIGWEGRGDFVVDAQGRVRRPAEGEGAPYVFTGVEIIHPRVFQDCPAGAFSLSRLWEKSRGADGFYTRIRAVIHPGVWINVGDVAALAAAEQYLVNR